MRIRSALFLAAGAAFGLPKILRQRHKYGSKPVVFITGGSRGLGLALAHEYARLGARLVLCSRDLLELRIAEKKLLPYRTEVLIWPCDLREPQQIQNLIGETVKHFGRIDVLINNAGVMEVAPLEVIREEEMRDVIETNLWGMIRTTLYALPHMPRGSRIVNITSIGGAVAVPHLLPYTISKFGALGFSLGLDAELVRKKISVTTILPGLMRTGSFVNALFKGDYEKEFTWFALGGALPLSSISAESAAKKIVRASRLRKRFSVLGPQAKLLRILYQSFPESSLTVMRLVNRLLPAPAGASTDQPEPGRLHRSKLRHNSAVTKIADRAGDQLNENIV